MSSAVIQELDILINTFNNGKHISEYESKISNDTISHNVLKAYQLLLALGLSFNTYSWHNLNQIKTIIHLKTQLKHEFIINDLVMNRKEYINHLFYGYVRNIQNNSIQQMLIPNEVVDICIKYWSINIFKG
eukprot:171215_1